MTNEEVERAIEFLLHHHAKVSADIERHSEQISQLTSNVDALTANVEAMREEMREGFNRLILANEQTTELIGQIARLNVSTSQRVTQLEGRVDDLESKG